MEKIFRELLAVRDVRGVLLLADNGELQYRKVADSDSSQFDSVDWLSMLNTIAGLREADWICEGLRIYIRKSEGGYLIVLMGQRASPALVRLNCDLILPALKDAGGARGIRRFFKR
jgi:hypothetical protein